MGDQEDTLKELRRRLESAFRPDTASQGFSGTASSTGQCAAVAAIVHELLRGEMLSTMVEGHSHWINRIEFGGENIDVDLTGDQFGLPPIQIGRPNELYPGLRVRAATDVAPETLERARLLAERAGLPQIARALAEKLVARSELPSRQA